MSKLKRALTKRRILSISVCLVIFVMSLGYAALSQHMDIDGIASIDRNWIVKITGASSSVTNSAVDDGRTYVGTTITMHATIPTTTATVTYTITLTNEGNIPAKLSSIEKVEDENSSITYEIEGVKEGYTVLNPGETNTVKVTIKAATGVTNISKTKKDLMLTFNYVENSGNSESNSGDSSSTTEKIAYKPGDSVMFDPGNGTERLFYVVSTSDTTANSTVQLISSTSVGSSVAGSASSSLTSLTSTWTKATSKRLPTMNEIGNLSGFTFSSGTDYTGKNIVASSEVLGGSGIMTVTSSTYSGQYYTFTTSSTGGTIKLVSSSTYASIRPVITVNKSDLKSYDVYKTGDKVTLVDGTKWYVTKDSGTSNGMVTLISYYTSSTTGNVSGSYSSTKAFDTSGDATYNKEKSTNIGYFLENTSLPYYKNQMKNNSGDPTGMTIRLLTKPEYDEIVKNNGGLVPAWIPNSYNYQFWLMTKSSSSYAYYFNGTGLSTTTVVTAFRIRPVITILKSNIKTVDLGYRIAFVDNTAKSDSAIDFSKGSTYNPSFEQGQATTTSTVTFSSTTTYYFGKSYKFDATTGKYSLAGTTTSGTWSSRETAVTTYPYTCQSTTSTATCSTLYKMATYTSTTSGTGYKYTIHGIGEYHNNGQGLYFTSTNTEGSKEMYYFRGDIKNNYVKFANKYWRIVRVNEDGSIRLIYQGTSASSSGTSAEIGTGAFNTSNNDNAYLGYMYGYPETSTSYGDVDRDGDIDSSDALRINQIAGGLVTATENDKFYGDVNMDGTLTTDDGQAVLEFYTKNITDILTYASSTARYNATHKNLTSSSIKTQLDNWYKNNLNSYSSYIVDAGFCGDRSKSTSELGYGNKATIYSANTRFNSSRRPKFNCAQTNDLYTTSSNSKGNKTLTYPIGLITLDEVIAAGGTEDINVSYYLYNGGDWWTMTPLNFSGTAGISYTETYGLRTSTVSNSHGIRPVINIKPDVAHISGKGTSGDPYVFS